ncbi:PLP-dependent transferase [Lichtheimia hyalospora FSU 10163]|nr:PLP-dependent transferase [Lichtheimia hyalospora FSU 10163]
MPSRFLPTRAFQAYQIFAANTNVGKTILATGLCRAAAERAKQQDRDVYYMKPVQTGYPQDSDARHVQTYSPNIHTETLFKYPEPVSPHIATDKPPHDQELLDKIKERMIHYVNQSHDRQGAYAFLETAGGIHSPVMSGTPQADFYRPLRLPSVLVGDSNLGGISTTMASYESLLVRGYDIPALLLFENERYRNHEQLITRLPKTLVSTVPAPPPINPDPIKEKDAMTSYYTMLDDLLQPVIRHLDEHHQARFERLAEMEDKARDTFWWPFTQHGAVNEVTVIDSAYNDYFTAYRKDKKTGELAPSEMFDSCASWWTQGLGHANPRLTLAAAAAAGRYGHVMFPETANEPALSLAERILEKDTWAQRVFFSDNGSTAIEVALKMAMRSAADRYGWSDNVPVDVIGLEGGYHGDTIGAMDACSPNTYNKMVQWYQPRGHWLNPPSIHICKGTPTIRLPNNQGIAEYKSLDDIYSIEKRTNDPLADVYRDMIRKELTNMRGRHVGALLMEPIILGAGGMIFADPLYQRILVDTVRHEGASLLGYEAKKPEEGWQGIPIIFDEVFAGWYRLGRRSASDFLGVKPDIVGYAKTLTGGLLPLALTVTKNSLFDVFLSANKEECLLHGHSYTAHPMGCAVANETIDNLEEMANVTNNNNTWTPFREAWKENQHAQVWSMWNPATVDKLSHLACVDSVMTLGSILAVELKDNQTKGYGSVVAKSILHEMRHGQFDSDINLFVRPLGNVIYLMTSQITTADRVNKCEEILLKCLE